MAKWQRILFWSILAAALLVRVSVSLADYRSLIGNDILQDDAFYYFKIAANIVHGKGLTFDGIHPTAGFQPLYVLLLIPVMALCGSDPVAPLHVANLMLAVIGAATGMLLFRLTRRLVGPNAGLSVLALWTVSPYFILFSVNGMETGLAMFFAVATLHGYLRFRSTEGRLIRKDILFGSVCGLSVMARLDMLLLLFAMAVDWGWCWLRQQRRTVAWKRALLVGVVALATWAPWGITSRIATGHWLPTSGSASRLIALNYGWINLKPIWTAVAPDDRVFDPTNPPLAYFADVATKGIFTFLLEHPLLGPLRVATSYSMWPDLDEYPPYAWFAKSPAAHGALIAILLAGLGAVGLRSGLSRSHRDPQHLSLALVLTVFSILVLLVYPVCTPSHWYFTRYFTTAVLLTTVGGVASVARLLSRTTRARGMVVGATFMSLLLACQLNHMRILSGLQWSEAEPQGFLASWLALEPYIEPEARIGVFQAGIVSYFSGLDVINLDGKVNEEAYESLRARRLHRYIEDAGLRYIADWPWVIWSLCTRHPGSDLRGRVVTTENRGAGFVLVELGE
jgi:hypothetical protein